ncbi:MAG TPA: hypothetical protein DGG95_12350 [Cytophagales bacterium]|nr:hypothetical protein [Cytophagales bacterium]
MAQLKKVPIVRSASASKKNISMRTQSLSAMKLPFWDDFSFNNSPQNYANDTLWQYGQSVWVNSGMAINPPTINVATFNGIDSLGLPYNLTIPLAKGVADKLVSRPLSMDLVDSLRRDSIFIFFYYQWKGNGESPDLGDDFSLWFKTNQGIWKQVWSDTVSNHNDSTFIPVKFFFKDLKEEDSIYFYEGFQFRFQNYARLSGPFDTWNLDYVYVNNGLSQYDPVRPDFPDRAFASTPTSILKQYRSMPVKHLMAKGDTVLNYISIPVTNQRKDQTPTGQPVSLKSYITTSFRLKGSTTSIGPILYDTLNASTFSPFGVAYGANTIFEFDSIPNVNALAPKVDSVAYGIKIFLNTADNEKKEKVIIINPNGTTTVKEKGDYDTIVYKGIDFRVNDTIQTNYTFTNYYAYDDGVAEYAVTLTQPGDYLAYQFDMLYNEPDTLSAIDIYFPHVGDESNQILKLLVFRRIDVDSLVKSSSIMTRQDLTVPRTENSLFTRIKLDTPLVVSKKFYIGYKQNSTATIGVGLDRNSEAKGKLFYNTSGTWQVSEIPGSPMIRAVFGNGKISTVTAIDESNVFLYPNPCHGIFYLPQGIQGLRACDLSGRPVEFIQEDSVDKTQISLKANSPGLYIIHYYSDNRWHSDKVMVVQ